MKIKLSYFWVGIILISGCSSDNGPHFTDDIIVVGQVYPHQQVRVFVGFLNTDAALPYGQGPYKPIGSANVQVILHGQNFQLQYVDPHDNDDYRDYQDVDHLIDVNAGDTLRLVVTTSDKVLEAETIVPLQPALFLNDGDTVIVQITGRVAEAPRPLSGIKDKGQLNIKSAMGTPFDMIRSYGMYYFLFIPNGPSFYSFQDSVILDVYVDTNAVFVPNKVFMTVYDTATTFNENLWLDHEISLIQLDADVQDFNDQLAPKKLAERTNISGGLGFWGSGNSTHKDIIMKIVR